MGRREPDIPPLTASAVRDGRREGRRVDDDVFTRFHGAQSPLVRAYLLRCTDAATADELASAALEIAWRRWADVPPEAALPWLYGVARRLLANADRAATRRASLAARLAEEPHRFPGTVGDPADGVCAAIDVARAFDRLSPTDQELLRLVAWEQLDPHQAAAALRCSRATFAVRLHRARARLRRALGAPEPGGQPMTPLAVEERS